MGLFLGDLFFLEIALHEGDKGQVVVVVVIVVDDVVTTRNRV